MVQHEELLKKFAPNELSRTEEGLEALLNFIREMDPAVLDDYIKKKRLIYVLTDDLHDCEGDNDREVFSRI